jgi:hypothetical protein
MIISWWMAGISYSFSVFFFTTLVSLLSTVAGEAIGLLIGAAIYDMEKAMTVVTVVSLGMMLVGGFFVEKLPVFIEWGRYLSPFNYTFNAARQVVFNRSVPCDGSGFLQDLCLSRTVGTMVPVQEVLEFLSNDGSLAFNVGMLLVLGLVPRYLAYVALRSKKEAER